MKAEKIFIIGVGGAGKTTCGRIVAEKLNYKFLDLDLEFLDIYGDIGNFIQERGYNNYCQANSHLFYDLLEKNKGQKIIFVLSSGFVTYDVDNLSAQHLSDLKRFGVSVMLMPSEDLERSVQTIVNRQLQRNFGLNKIREEEKFRNRYPLYKSLGDIQIFSYAEPEEIANEIISKLE